MENGLVSSCTQIVGLYTRTSIKLETRRGFGRRTSIKLQTEWGFWKKD